MILAVHIAAGSAALLSMVVPMVAKKGGTLHRRAGWVFVAGMATVSVTALVLAAARFLDDPSPRGQAGGLFLFYIAILTGAGVSAGVRVLRARRRTTQQRHPWDLGIATTLTLSALAMAAYGVATGQTLFVAFSLVGLVNGVAQLRYWLRAPTHPMHWWFAHMSAMLGACIAAATAFLVVNAGRLGFESFSLVIWLTPAAIGAPGIAIWRAYYTRTFAASRAPSTPSLARGEVTGQA